MNIVRKILSHGVLLVVVLMLILAFFFRDQLMPGLFKKDAAPVAETQPAAPEGSAETPAQAEATVSATAQDTAQPAAATAAGTQEAAQTAAAATAAAAAGAPAAGAPSAAADAKTAAASGSAASMAPGGEGGVSSAAESTTAAATDADTDPAAASDDPAVLLTRARRAFWRGDRDAAVAGYKALAEAAPDDPNAYGELGNIYYSDGKWNEAASAYYEAATRLLKDGRSGEAVRLLQIIRGLDSERAAELEKQLQSSSG